MRKKDIYAEAAKIENSSVQAAVFSTLDKIFKHADIESLMLTGEVLNDYTLKLPEGEATYVLVNSVLAFLRDLGLLEELFESDEVQTEQERFINAAFKASGDLVRFFGRDSLHAAHLERTRLEQERVEIDRKLVAVNQRIYRLTK